MEIRYTVKELLTQRTINSARGARINASPEDCKRSDSDAWAEHRALEALLSEKLDDEITVEYKE